MSVRNNRLKEFLARSQALFRRHWLLIASAILVAAFSTLSAPAWAKPVTRPLHQTVPIGTPPPPMNPVVPTPTPLPPDPAPAPDPRFPDLPPQDAEDLDDIDSVPFVFPQTNGDAPARTEGEPLTAIVTVGTLNVRAGPGTGYAIIGVFNANQEVVVEARNNENSWWHVCCLVNTETRGWVSAPLLQSNFDRSQAAQLIPLYGATPATAAAAPLPAQAPVVDASAPISLTLSYTPTFVWQGKTFDLEFTIVNPTDTALRNLEISDELPLGLNYVAARGEGGPEIIERDTGAGGKLIILRWPRIPADAMVRAWITVTVDPDLPAGAVLDNLAAARAANAGFASDGVSIGLPPATIPDFQ